MNAEISRSPFRIHSRHNLRSENYKAIVHTAAASQLVKQCNSEDVPLVNIVRSEVAATALTQLGAEHVVVSLRETYTADLHAAVTATKATIGFDATGGGTLAAEIITAMEGALRANGDVPHPGMCQRNLWQAWCVFLAKF